MGRTKKVKVEDIPNKETQQIEVVSIVQIVKSKRGRKSKKIDTIKPSENIIYEINEVSDYLNSTENKLDELNISDEDNKNVKAPAKKRGRKPKGGKIIQQIIALQNVKETKPNVILHLKCSLKDLDKNAFSNSIDGYNFGCKTDLNFDIISVNESMSMNFANDNKNINSTINNGNNSNATSSATNEKTCDFFNDDCDDLKNYNKDNKENEMKEIWKKLKSLEHNLHINNISDKKSACFWCTYDFDTPPIYIPKYFLKDSYHVYGCFCSPECATAYLMEENIDTSSKFERYHLLNHIYSKIYDYKKNVKPSPNPFYMLDKYYGNLNIQEYRALLKSERLFLVVDKPLTRILPEFHEDNDDFIINNKIIPSNTYQIKRKMTNNKNLTKTNILNEKFGMTTQQ
jgi:hypothetical protein